MKDFFGYAMFVLGLLLSIGQTLEQYNNIFFHLIGLALLIYGLQLIIDSRVHYVYNNSYSPKARVKKLWEEIHRYAAEIGKINKKFPEKPGFYGVTDGYKAEIKKREKKIDTLLNSHFDPVDDEEFIHDNRP